MKDESGNALFLILIAVALFAALSYAVTSSGRSSGGIEKEQAKIDQAVLDNYTAALDAARMRLNIVSRCDSIDYTAPADQPGSGDKSCYMFHPDGGGVAYQDLMDSCLVTGIDVTTLAIGESCGNVIYAGTSSGNRLYIPASNLGQLTWGPSPETTGINSATDGIANTNALVARAGSYPAAEGCRALGEDWYLPAINELNVLYTNRHTGDLNGIFVEHGGGLYISSTEGSQHAAQLLNFSNGVITASYGKGDDRYVHCVRQY